MSADSSHDVQRWPPGAHITVRTVWHGHVHAAFPMTVVEDKVGLLVAYMGPGQLFKRPYRPDGSEARVPHGEWEFRDEEWTASALRFFVPGEAHSVIAFLGSGGVDRWYVNLEDPFRRTPMGLDIRDHMLDIVLSADLREHRWKDEWEIEEALSLGVVSVEEVAAFRHEGERVVEWLRDGHPAVDERWRGWTPPPEWTTATLPPGWASIENAPP